METLPIMCHKPSTINIAKLYFENYLTDEELQERQFNGRPWDLEQAANFCVLYIILDDKYYVSVISTDYEEIVREKKPSLVPMSLKPFSYSEHI